MVASWTGLKNGVIRFTKMQIFNEFRIIDILVPTYMLVTNRIFCQLMEYCISVVTYDPFLIFFKNAELLKVSSHQREASLFTLFFFQFLVQIWA